MYIKQDTHKFNQESGKIEIHPIKLTVNPARFQEMMEAGSFFLHLKEFVDCMQNANIFEKTENGVGLILQAFSLSVAEFLRYYQSHVLQFQNKVAMRRAFESKLLFGEASDLKDEAQSSPTLLELKIHMKPVMDKLRLLATICFTQNFINNIDEVNKENKAM
jgi:hypothetical protein